MLVPGIHRNRPTEMILRQYLMYGRDCLVCVQSASNSSHVGACAHSVIIIACSIDRVHGGLVMMSDIPLGTIDVKASARSTQGAPG